MDLSQYKRVILAENDKYIKTREQYEADLIIQYYNGKFITKKDRYNRPGVEVDLDDTMVAKFFLENKKIKYLKWEEIEIFYSKEETNKFNKAINEALQ
jgi:hypothetical protein